MPTAKTPHKARFLAALRLAEMTMSEWATMHGVTQGYVSNLLAGRRENPEIAAKVDAFTRKYMRGNTASAR